MELIVGLVNELRNAREDARHFEWLAALALKRVRRLEEEDIPQALDSLGVEAVRLPDGTSVELARDVRACVPVETRAAAYDWLERNGHDGMIKRILEVHLGRDAEDVEDIKARIGKYETREERKVEPSTLSKWVRERLRNGEVVPESISVTDRNIAKVR